MISESSWPNFENLSLQNEADVETRFIYPLVQALGFETNEIYSKVPIEFNEGKKGRKHEADFVLAPGGQKQLEKTWIVIETKSPKEELQKAQKQVESYVRHLKAPFFLKTNGKDLEVWKNPPYSQDQLIFNSKISNLFNKRGELERILSREVVRNFLEKFEETKSIVKNVNAQDYFKFLSEFAFDGLIAPRKLISGENEKDIVTIDETTDPGTFFDNRKLLVIQGLGGYGKTTVIKMILRKTFKELELNSFPLRIILNNETKSLVASIRKSLNSFSVGLDSDEALVDWLKNNKNLIIFDDWEKLPEIRRDLFEEEIRELLLTQSWIVISTRPTEKFIKADFRLLKIVKYSEEERNEVIKINFLDESWLQENPDKIFGKIDEGLKDLLFVPVFLEIYIKLVKRTPYGSLERPHNVTELMDKLLDRSLEKSLLLKSSEVIACCNKLVNSGKNYYLINEIEDARKACGASFSPSDFAQAMKECGVFSEFSPGIYSFGHDVWNIYFKYRSFFKELLKPGDIRKWINSEITNDSGLALSFAVGAANTVILQNELFEALLEKDLILYLSFLKAKGSVFKSGFEKNSEIWFLDQMKKGYVSLIVTWFKELKHYLFPWNSADSDEVKDKKMVICSFFENPVLAYYFGFGPKMGEEIIKVEANPYKIAMDSHTNPEKRFLRPLFSPSKGYEIRGIDFQKQENSVNDGRLLATEIAIDKIKKLINERDIPSVDWVAREKVIDFSRSQLNKKIDDKKWQDLTIVELEKWFLKRYAEYLDSGEGEKNLYTRLEVAMKAVSINYNGFKLKELISSCKLLRSEGFENKKLEQLCLPGPDIAIYGQRAHHSYSYEKKLERLSVYHQVIMLTYKSICEKYFGEVKKYFFYSQMPLRTVISTHGGGPGEILKNSGCYTYWFEPVMDWDCKTLIIDEQVTPKDYDEIFGNIKEKFSQLGRKLTNGISITSTVGNWSMYESNVTSAVCRMLTSDLKSLKELI